MNKDKLKMNLQYFAESEENLTRNLGEALSIDFVEQFGGRLNSLFELLDLHRIVPVASGTLVKTYKSSVTLNNDPVPPGAVIPLSEVEMEEGPSHEITWDKKRKAVPAEDIQKYGFNRAIIRTDNKLSNELRKEIRNTLLENLANGTGEQSGAGFQKTLAKNTAAVKVAFEEDDPEVISFANTFDVYDYLGDKDITLQTAFGMTYVENFLDNRILFLSGDIPSGTVYSTAVDNMVFYYVDIAGGQIAQAFDFTTQEDGIIGVTHDINKQRLTSETITMFGALWLAERLDGIIVGTFEAPVEDNEGGVEA